jgi:hypothetical protein
MEGVPQGKVSAMSFLFEKCSHLLLRYGYLLVPPQVLENEGLFSYSLKRKKALAGSLLYFRGDTYAHRGLNARAVEEGKDMFFSFISTYE